jgi:ribonuclease P/MRP protein subunit POP5
MVRYKSRYFLLRFSFSSEDDRRRAYSSISEKTLRNTIKQSILTLHGDYGLACVQSNLNVKYFNVTTDIALLRVPRDYYRLAWSAITVITHLLSSPCSINIIHVGGTIKSCQKRLIAYNYNKLKDHINNSTSLVKRRKLKLKIMEVIKKDSLPLKA